MGKGGEVEGDVISREAIIGGEVRGSIRADERIEIQSTSVVHGDVAAKRLLVQEGGEINGVVRMGEGALEEEAVEKVTAGRGGLGPRWISPPGALFVGFFLPIMGN